MTQPSERSSLRHHSLSEEKMKRLLRVAAEERELTMADLAQRFGVHANTVKRVLQQAGVRHG